MLLGGRPLVDYAVAAMVAAGLPTMLVTKRGAVAARADVRQVIEPDEPLHPLMGVLTALEESQCAVVVCAGDMPFVSPALLRALADHRHEGAVVTAAGGQLQPLLGRYGPDLIPALRVAIAAGDSARGFVRDRGETVLTLGDEVMAGFGDPTRLVFDVDTPGDLAAASTLLADGGDPEECFSQAKAGDNFDR